MFHAKITEGIILIKLIDSIKDIITEINLNVNSQGISFQSMDIDHVALLEVKLSSEGFEEYQCNNSMTFGIKISNLYKILRLGGIEDSLSLSSEDGKN